MKYLRLYEKFEDDFEETWIDDESSLEIDISNVKLGKDGPEFKVLDKVKVIVDIYADYSYAPKINLYNKIGYVIDCNTNNEYLIYFIENVNGHDGNNVIKKYSIPFGHGWWINSYNLKKI